MKKVLLIFSSLLLLAVGADAQVLINESFNVSTVSATPPTGWSVSSTGSNVGCNSTNWSRVPSGGFVCSSTNPQPNPTPHSGTGMAGYNSWDIPIGGSSDLVTPSLNFTGLGPIRVSFWVYNSAFGYEHDSLYVFVNTIASPYGANSTLLYAGDPTYAASPTGWVQYSYIVPSTYNGASNYIVFHGGSRYGYDVFFDDVVVMAATPPAPTPFTSNSPICPNSTAIFTATAPAGYDSLSFTLSGPGISPITNATGVFTLPNVSPTNAGTYSVTVSSRGYTSAPATTVLSFYPTPTAISTSNLVTPTSCLSSDGSFSIDGLQANTSYTLNFRKSGVNQPSMAITSNSLGSYTLTGLSAAAYDSIRVTSLAPSNCTSNYITVPVVVPAPNPPPTPVINATNPVCPGSTLSLSVSNVLAGATYSWLAPNPLVNPLSTSGATATRANMSNALDGVYSAKVTVTATGCSSIGTVSVTTSQPDPKPLTFRRTYCQYETAVPIVAQTTIPGAVLTYYTVPIGGVGSTTAPTPSTLVPGVTKYYVSQTKTCESLRDTVYILVNPTPLPPTTNNAKLEYCQYETASPLSASGTNILWFTTPTGGVGSPTAPTPSTLLPGNYYFYASQTSNYLGGHSCESNRLMFTVVVKPKPAPPGVTSPFNLCQGDPIVPLTAVGQNLLWYTVANGGVGVPVAPLPNTGYEDSFQYYVTQTVLGCESDRALMKVIVNYKPNGILSASTYNVCQGEIDSFFYFGNARPDAEYNWYASLSATFLSGKGTRGPVVISFDTSGTSYVRLTIDNKGCISDLITAPITVRPLPKFNFVQPQDACENQLVNIGLNYHDEGITGYNWDFGTPDALLEYGDATTGGPLGVRYPKAGHYAISATATKAGCTSKPIGRDIYIHTNPDATITPSRSPLDICTSDTLYLQVPAVPEGATYSWSPLAYFQGLRDTLNNGVFAVVSQTSQVKVKVKTAYGCEAEDSLLVTTKPCCNVYFPNAFAPTGNVVQNRLFRPITIGHHKINSFRVINRWGQVVYESRVETNGWDGTYNGKPQDMGTYYYYINYKCDGKNIEDRGEFLLLR
ncbi:MAG: gliding motility-associated C-terminal domain-containing protein [Bacteroidetes bacterium]|nr:gliding motility-associated C-terminal domain-containing protein [Bacteroidota bacterium]